MRLRACIALLLSAIGGCAQIPDHIRIEVGGTDIPGMNGERVGLLPFGRSADRTDQFNQRLGVADARNILQRDRMLGQKRGRDDRQSGVLVTGRLDRTTEPMAPFDGVLNRRHLHVLPTNDT